MLYCSPFLVLIRYALSSSSARTEILSWKNEWNKIPKDWGSLIFVIPGQPLQSHWASFNARQCQKKRYTFRCLHLQKYILFNQFAIFLTTKFAVDSCSNLSHIRTLLLFDMIKKNTQTVHKNRRVDRRILKIFSEDLINYYSSYT